MIKKKYIILKNNNNKKVNDTRACDRFRREITANYQLPSATVEHFRVISWRNFAAISPGIFTVKFFVYFSFKRNFAVKNGD